MELEDQLKVAAKYSCANALRSMELRAAEMQEISAMASRHAMIILSSAQELRSALADMK